MVNVSKKDKKPKEGLDVKVDCSKGTPDEIWLNNPEIIRHFLDIQSDYDQLCTEVEYILRKQVDKCEIEISTISSRAKTLNSFLEKLQRKNYNKPFEHITDFAGVRLVCLYLDDISKIAEIVRSEFVVVDEVNKIEELGADKFGYEAMHFIVRLGESTTGARYDNLKKLVCEIQIRTVVQDAWAIIQHHMIYKRESQVPTQLQRKLNSLSGLFETVDDQFETIRKERYKYLTDIRETVKTPEAFLANELNLDSFNEYLRWKFPSRSVEAFDGQSRNILNHFFILHFRTLEDVDRLINETFEIRKELLHKTRKFARKSEDGKLPSSVEPLLAIIASIPEWEEILDLSPEYKDEMKKVLVDNKRSK